MQNINDTLQSLFGDFHHYSLGLVDTFSNIDQVRAYQHAQNYPPYDLVKVDDEHYQLVLAVAGYSVEQLSINIENGVLTVEGSKSDDDKRGFIHKGISSKQFIRKFYLDHYFEVKDTTLVDGLLTINIDRHLPDYLKPKNIAINTPSKPTLTNQNTYTNLS